MYPWGVLLQALAMVHFLRRRPETVWMYVILFLGPPGALIYILIEVVPDLGLLRHVYDAFGRRRDGIEPHNPPIDRGQPRHDGEKQDKDNLPKLKEVVLAKLKNFKGGSEMTWLKKRIV